MGALISKGITNNDGIQCRDWVEKWVPSKQILCPRQRDRRRGSGRARGRNLWIETSGIWIRRRQDEEDSQAMTRPPNLPTPRTLPQSLPSTLTTLHASSPSRSFILVLACPLTPSSPPSTCSGSSSGFVRPSHLLSIFKLGVSTPILNIPWALADSIRRDCEEGASDARPRLLADVEVERASLVKRSDMALSWRRDGSMI